MGWREASGANPRRISDALHLLVPGAD